MLPPFQRKKRSRSRSRGDGREDRAHPAEDRVERRPCRDADRSRGPQDRGVRPGTRRSWSLSRRSRWRAPVCASQRADFGGGTLPVLRPAGRRSQTRFARHSPSWGIALVRSNVGIHGARTRSAVETAHLRAMSASTRAARPDDAVSHHPDVVLLLERESKEGPPRYVQHPGQVIGHGKLTATTQDGRSSATHPDNDRPTEGGRRPREAGMGFEQRATDGEGQRGDREELRREFRNGWTRRFGFRS